MYGSIRPTRSFAACARASVGASAPTADADASAPVAARTDAGWSCGFPPMAIDLIGAADVSSARGVPSLSVSPAADGISAGKLGGPLSAAACPQLEALDLAGRRLRQLGDELDPARVLVTARARALTCSCSSARERVRPASAGLSTTKALRLDQLVLVGVADDRGLEHRVVAWRAPPRPRTARRRRRRP